VSFAEQFWLHLRPSLTRLTIAEARCVAAGVETYGNAWSVVMDYARNRGALHLPVPDQDELIDWIGTTLCLAILEAEAAGWGEWLERNHIDPSGARV
jgi:hypothetical protein